MIRSTFFTFAAKVFTALMNFGIALLTARYLGAEGRGIISLLVLNISMVFMISSLVGGPGLVYLAPRKKTGELVGASLAWALVSSIVVPLIIWITGFAGEGLLVHLMVLSLLQFIVRIHLNWLLAHEKIKAFNLVSVIHPVMLAILLVFFFYGRHWHDVLAFVAAYYAAVVVSLVLSSVIMFRNKALRFSWRIREAMASSFRLGYVIQGGNLLQLLNYRFAYYLLQSFFGKAQVGLFSMATAFSEASWMVANSFATIQYGRIVNSTDDAANARITLVFLRLALWLTFVPVIVLLMLPAGFYRYFLGKEFADVAAMIPWLAPGILFVVISIVLTHYFSGSGNPKVGFIGSAAGFVATLAAGFVLVPAYGTAGAALTASVSYGVTAVVVLVLFSKRHALSPKDFLLSGKDIRFIRQAGKQVP